MKLPFLLFTLVAFFGASLNAAVSPISITVEQHSKTKQPQAKSGKPSQGPKTQVRSLTVKLSNTSAETFDTLVVKYWFLGRDLKDNDLKVLKHGERKSALAARGRDTVESEEVTSTYTEAHSQVTKGKGGKGGSKGGKGGSKGGVSIKKVPASGQKIAGYAVRVMNGAKVEAEYYSEASYKGVVAASASSKSADADKPAAKKKTPAKKKK